jgi:tRNA modification GTPase
MHALGDTIAAIATAPGVGAVALVRISGPDARQILARLCPELHEPAPRRQSLVTVRHPADGAPLDRSLAAFFPAPASYTGEDVVELSTHGGHLAPRLVLDAALAAGARPAEPGEFTRRAYLNGRMDLLQAEAVLDLVEGRSEALHRAALHQADRGLTLQVERLREGVLALEAAMIHAIDFPEEDEAPLPLERLHGDAAELRLRMRLLLATAAEGEMLREGALVVLAGRPNSGKSSLFNALLGRERAIVTEVPGTTRDALEAEASFSGYPVRLVDTAGLRDTADRVEGMGIEVARRYLAAARLVLLCVEGSRPLGEDEREFMQADGEREVLLVRTMADLPGGAEGEGAVSALSGEGVAELRATIARRVFAALHAAPAEAPLLTRRRQARALRGALDEVEEFGAALERALPPEIAATHLRAALHRLEELIGTVETDELLGEVFSRFCIGK